MSLQIPAYMTYPIYTAFLAVALVALVPRAEIKRLIFSGILLGAVANFAVLIPLVGLLNLGGHVNYGPLGAFGVSFFPPLAWAIWFIMYFYFMPEKPWQRVTYLIAAAGYSVFFSNILINFDVFEWKMGKVFVPFLIYFSWFALATYLFYRFSMGTGENDRSEHA